MFRKTITQELSLLILEKRYAQELFMLVHQNRKHLSQWLPWVKHTSSVLNSVQFIQNNLQAFAEGKGIQTGIEYEGKLQGLASIFKIDPTNKTGYMAYWLAENMQGKGIITKACITLLDYAFLDLKLEKIEIRCATKNFKSQAIPKRLEFVEEGTLRRVEKLASGFVDHIVFGMLQEDWLVKKESLKEKFL